MQNYNEEIVKKYFDFRLGNGIQILENGEVDVVVIAGMGGVLMTEILGQDLVKTKSLNKIILQPRNGQGKLRWWLLNNGFNIKEEKIVREGKFICEIIGAEPINNDPNLIELPKDEEKELKKQSEDIECEVPESILISNGALALEFIEKKLEVELNVFENIKKATLPDYEKVCLSETRIKYLQSLLNKYEKRGD